MSTKKNKQKSLSEKVSESFLPPSLADPENDSADETSARFAELDEDENFAIADKQLSQFRKRNVKMLSEHSDKYKGKLSSRKELIEADGDNSQDGTTDPNESDDDDDLEQYMKKLKNCQLDSEPDESFGTDEDEDEEKMKETDSGQDDDSDYDSPGEDASVDEEVSEGETNTELLKESNQIDDIKKGLAVQSQLKMWEKLLEVRIHSQKMLIKANSLPEPHKFEKLCSTSDQFAKLADETKQNVSILLDKMLEMQTNLTTQFSETKDLLKSAQKRQSYSKDTTAQPPIKKFAAVLQENFENFRGYRNSVLQRWHDRTKILAPGSSKGSRNDFDVVKKIEAVLLNKSDLVKKSRIVKGNYKLFQTTEGQNAASIEADAQEENEKTQEEISSEIYDDTDFYHQQLRELIEFKANTTASPSEVTKQFAELQKLRQKMKKKVDTRASKGRKISEQCRKWLEILGKLYLVPDSNTAVCSNYFKENGLFTKDSQRPIADAVPSLRLGKENMGNVWNTVPPDRQQFVFPSDTLSSLPLC